MKITTVGLDLAKNVFQVHGVDAAEAVVVRKVLRRRQMIPFFSKLEPCLIGMEACGTSHHWARELSGLGHQVKLMPPVYVKPYVKRGKTDAADAEAICEAVTRPTMRFVAIKSTEQQSILALHRTRDLLIRQRPQMVNMIRAQLAEFGIVVAKGSRSHDRTTKLSDLGPNKSQSQRYQVITRTREDAAHEQCAGHWHRLCCGQCPQESLGGPRIPL